MTASAAYASQFKDLRDELRTRLIVPVAYVLDGARGCDWKAFSIQVGHLGGRIEAVDQRGSVVVRYEDKPPELWLHGADEGYLGAYLRYSRDFLGRRLDDGVQAAGFAVDHAYNRGRVAPWGIAAYHRAFLVPARANSSWGAFFEKGLGSSGCGKGGLRNGTVAILAKIAGVSAPRSRTMAADVAAIIERLVVEGLIDRDRRDIDKGTLSAFFGIARHRSVGMTLRLSSSGDLEEIVVLRRGAVGAMFEPE